jgi:hypothetical protein
MHGMPDKNGVEKEVHSREIQRLANEFRIREETLKAIYDFEMDKLKSTSHITTYLSILVSRRVRELISANASELQS